MSDFNAEYQPLDAAAPALGEIAVLPWDAATFGFPVADWRLRSWDDGTALSTIRTALEHWAVQTGTELISCRLPADNRRQCAQLVRIGFTPVETALTVSLPNIALAPPQWELPFRPAAPDDAEAIEQIAGAAFTSGRYHADPRFPRALADRRYMQWIRNALIDTDPRTRMYVICQQDAICGFFHAVLDGTVADLRLTAVDPRVKSRIVGYNLYVQTLLALKAAGARQATALIAATNTAVMNLYAVLGFRFSQPEQILHWHAPGARHLIEL